MPFSAIQKNSRYNFLPSGIIQETRCNEMENAVFKRIVITVLGALSLYAACAAADPEVSGSVRLVRLATGQHPMRIEYNGVLYDLYNDRRNNIPCGKMVNPETGARQLTPPTVFEELGIHLAEDQKHNLEHRKEKEGCCECVIS